MTTVAFVFLTLFTWIVSSGTWLSLDQCTEPSQYGHHEETKGFSSGAPYKSAVTHDKTELTVTCERSPVMRVALERIYFPSVTLNCMIFNGCVNLLQRMKENVDGEKQHTHVYKCKFQQLLEFFQCKTTRILLKIEIKMDNPSTHLSHQSLSSVLRSVAHCSHIVALLLVGHWKAMDCVCICKAYNHEVKTLQSFLYRELGPLVPEYVVCMLSESLISSEKSKKAHVRICHMQMLSNFCAPCCPKKDFLKEAGRLERVRPADTSKWLARFFLPAVLLLGIYIMRIKISPNRVNPAPGNNSTMVILFTMSLQCSSLSSEWSCIALGISFAVCFFCALGRTVDVLIVCRAAHTVVKLVYTTQQQRRALHVTILFIWLTVSPSFPNKNVKQWFEDILGEGDVGSTLKSSTMLGQIELLATMYNVLALLSSFLAKLNFLSVLLNVQLAMLQNLRAPAEYVLVIKINKLI